MKRNWIKKIPLFILFGGGLFLLASGIFMLLWNAILPAVLHTGTVTLWQAGGILVLAKMLFGGFKRAGNGHWRRKMFYRWNNMTPEEKEKLRFEMRNHCGNRWSTPGTAA